MLKNIVCVIMLTSFLSSCSFKSDKDKDSKTRSNEELNADDLKKLDSDGDMINDLDEINQGHDRYIADIPKLSVHFLQDYSININYKDQESFILDTVIARENPDFKYRTGDLFLRENSLKNAAKIARFSSVSWGKIEQKDFSWIKYPRIDKSYYFEKAREYKHWKKSHQIDSSITLENSLKLLESPIFESIEEVELNFYYYSYKKESYVLIHTQKLDQVFHSGQREDFTITINNPPKELIEDTYFRHGEFIVSEIKDFFIPDLNIKYSDLMASVKAKTLPVYKTNPYENTLDYVAVSNEGEEFISILEKLLPKKFSVEENTLTQIEQFSSNLPDYKYLHEISSEDKLGKWFIMTNKLKQHYLKHKFRNTDTITLSYITGAELANQTQEKTYSLQSNIKSKSQKKLIPLGNITNNSSLSVSLFPNTLEGLKLNVEHGRFAFKPPRCRNCTGTNWSVKAEFQLNTFKSFKNDWIVQDVDQIKKAFDILINNTVLPMDELIENNQLSLELKGDESFHYFHLTLKNLHELEVIQAGKENVAYLQLKPLSVQSAGEGLQINKVSGKNIKKVHHAGMICFNEAKKRNAKIAVTSWKFSEWQKFVNWGKAVRGTKWRPHKGNKKKYWTGVDLDIVSTIENNYN